MKFSIGKGSYIYMGCVFNCAEYLSIGNSSVINANCRIDSRGGIVIGKNVSVSNDVIILTADHDINNNMYPRFKSVTIEDYVWIGTRATILPGVHLGKGAIVAAGAVVTKSVESFNVVAGVPARVINERKKENNFGYNSSFKRLFQ